MVTGCHRNVPIVEKLAQGEEGVGGEKGRSKGRRIEGSRSSWRVTGGNKRSLLWFIVIVIIYNLHVSEKMKHRKIQKYIESLMEAHTQ